MNIFFPILMLFCHTVTAQFEGLQINLEIQNSKKDFNVIRFSLYMQDSSLFCLGIKKNPVLNPKDYKTWLKRDADTVITISKDNFNKIATACMDLSSQMILRGMNPSNPMIWNEGIGVTLEIEVIMDRIIYSIRSPSYNTKERNLEPFLAICKEMLLLAKMKPKDYF